MNFIANERNLWFRANSYTLNIDESRTDLVDCYAISVWLYLTINTKIYFMLRLG